jgi:hypothetical protein
MSKFIKFEPWPNPGVLTWWADGVIIELEPMWACNTDDGVMMFPDTPTAQNWAISQNLDYTFGDGHASHDIDQG